LFSETWDKMRIFSFGVVLERGDGFTGEEMLSVVVEMAAAGWHADSAERSFASGTVGDMVFIKKASFGKGRNFLE